MGRKLLPHFVAVQCQANAKGPLRSLGLEVAPHNLPKALPCFTQADFVAQVKEDIVEVCSYAKAVLKRYLVIVVGNLFSHIQKELFCL